MKKSYGVFIRGCSKRVFKKYYGGMIGVDGVYYSFSGYLKLIKEVKLIKVGDLIYNPYRNIFEPIKEVKFTWESYKSFYGGNNNKHFPNIRLLEFIIISETDYYIYDFDYRLIEDGDDFKKAPIPNTTLKVWY